MESALSPWLFYDPQRGDDPALDTDRRHHAATAGEPHLVCGHCGHPIAREADRIAVGGNLTHDCTNPHGMTFRIGCFRHARGCKTVGPSTDEFTWFAGYVWTVAVCRNCDSHLGWLFRAVSDRFYGLILDRLAARAA